MNRKAESTVHLYYKGHVIIFYGVHKIRGKCVMRLGKARLETIKGKVLGSFDSIRGAKLAATKLDKKVT